MNDPVELVMLPEYWFEHNQEWLIDLFKHRAIVDRPPKEARGTLHVTISPRKGKGTEWSSLKIAQLLAQRAMKDIVAAFVRVEKRPPTQSDGLRIYTTQREFLPDKGQRMTVYYKWSYA